MTEAVVGVLIPIFDPLAGVPQVLDLAALNQMDVPFDAPRALVGFLFQITETRIGTAPVLDWRRTVISQYDGRPVMGGILGGISEDIDPTVDFDYFFDNIWNIDTARGYGLDVWGRIVGVGRLLTVAPDKFLGFGEAGALWVGTFNESRFYSGEPLTGNFSLSDTAYRRLIMAKAFSNISDGSTASFNTILRLLFAGRGNCYVVDNLDMTMKIVFRFQPTRVEVAIIDQANVLPRPAAVSQTFEVLS